MYTLQTPLLAVKGIGPILAKTLTAAGCSTVLDVLLQLPLRYEDRSFFTDIASAPQDTLLTIQATVLSLRTFYRGRRPITTARVSDDTGSVTLMWFNNTFVQQTLKVGAEYLFSGKINDRMTIVQPAFERLSGDSIHTNRLVPLYSSTLKMKQGSMRRILKHITDLLAGSPDPLCAALPADECMPLRDALCELHFPSGDEKVVAARERLALEELLALIRRSSQMKEEWKSQRGAVSLTTPDSPIPSHLPFQLTGAQERCIGEVMHDLESPVPMNRLLIGDVGSGKTVVAGTACAHMVASGYSAALVAPTQILASQHVETLRMLFPGLPVTLLTAAKKAKPSAEAQLYVGTHAVINALPVIKPALIVYDEQHRFGVAQRSQAHLLKPVPHILTMTATPIPRTLLLTIFSHLAVSVIDELPKNRLPTKTWLLTEEKRTDMFGWIEQQIQEQGTGAFQTLIICPFIDPSNSLALENIASTKDIFAKVQARFKRTAQVGLLHGRLKKTEKEQVIRQLFDKQLDILVTTPIVEVGIDLPQAATIVIESAERYGLASLHQLRGRVGRAGQQGYCMLFMSPGSAGAKKRLKAFTSITKGQELAELDLQNRGAGDLFGVAQSGFNELRFASWTNVALISRAQQLYTKLDHDWQPLPVFMPQTADSATLAN
jgi:ATP-dependent DNA helicase RecG